MEAEITYSVYISGVEFRGLLEEAESGVGVDDILDHGGQIFRRQPRSLASGHQEDHAGHLIVAAPANSEENFN